MFMFEAKDFGDIFAWVILELAMSLDPCHPISCLDNRTKDAAFPSIIYDLRCCQVPIPTLAPQIFGLSQSDMIFFDAFEIFHCWFLWNVYVYTVAA